MGSAVWPSILFIVSGGNHLVRSPRGCGSASFLPLTARFLIARPFPLALSSLSRDFVGLRGHSRGAQAI
jgi:hypothetical protein